MSCASCGIRRSEKTKQSGITFHHFPSPSLKRRSSSLPPISSSISHFRLRSRPRTMDTLHLEDATMEIEFDGGEQEVVTTECHFTEQEMDPEEMSMETDAQVIDNVEYIHTETSDMPILDDSLLPDTEPQVQIKIEPSQSIIESRKITSTPKVTRVANAAINQTYRISGSSVKPISIAPKPITMSNSSFVNMRKYSIAGVQQRAIGDISGRQVVVVPTSGNRFKMVTTPLRTQTPVQIQVTQRNVPPLTRLTIPAGKDTSSGIVRVQKASPARFISIPSQQVGLLGGKITQLVAVSPTKQPLATSTPTVRPIRPHFNSIKSPAKILPAPQGVTGGNKVILTAAPQNIVVRPAVSKPGQVVKVDGSTLLASIPAGQKINPQQIHQINIPGKGVQYVRLVPAPNLATQPTVSVAGAPSQSQPQVVTTAPSTSQPQTLATASVTKSKAPPPQLLPKTFLITDFKNNIVQMVSGKTKSIINTTVPGSSNVKKILGKPSKLVPISLNATSSSQILTDSQQVKLSGTTLKVETDDVISEEAIVKSLVASEIDSAKKESSEDLKMSQQEEFKEDLDSQEELVSNQTSEQDDTEDMLQDDDVESTSDPLNIVSIQGSHIYKQELQRNRSLEDDMKEEFSEYSSKLDSAMEFGMRPRKPCNCTKSQCLKLYCDCFANGEFCNQCNCNNCYNNLENEEYRQKAIRSCLERNPNAFRPKIGKAKGNVGLEVIRRHNKGCNCKRSGCLKNYCECYEGKIACSANCKCIGCRNVEDAIDKKILRRSKVESVVDLNSDPFSQSSSLLPLSSSGGICKQDPLTSTIRSPCNIMTNDVIEAVCQCLIAQAADAESAGGGGGAQKVLEEFAHCLKDIISVAQQHKSATSLV